ncbi:MAG: DUF1667 domain-containing protein [Candidatus Omnitrophota bacterium]
MAIKKLVCIECPTGCHITVDIEKNKVLKISGNKCPKGEKYALSEAKNPMRVLTTSVLVEGMPFKMLAVKTDKPIPKAKLFEAMRKVKKIRLKKPVHVGGVVASNFMGRGVNLIATKEFFWK